MKATGFLNKRMNWWLGVALVLPLIISRKAMEPIGALRFLVLSAFLAAFLGYFFLFRAKRLEVTQPRFLTLVLGALAAGFLLVLAGTSFAAVNRQEALYYTLRYFLAFTAALLFSITVLQEKELLPRLLKGLTVVLIIQSVVGISQFYGLAFTDLPPYTDKPYGLMANRNLFSSGLALLIPFAGYVAFVSNGRWKIISGAAVWLGTYGLLLGQTRSAWLAVACAIVISNLLVISLRGRLEPAFVRRWWNGMVMSLVGVILAAVLVAGGPNTKDFVGEWKGRALSVVQPSSIKLGTGASRLHLWRKTLGIIRDHPLVGVGPGNWRVVIPKYGFFQWPSLADGMYMPNEAHNVYLQAAAETGLPGLLIYLGIWGSATIMTISVILRSGHDEQRLLGMASLAAICIYSVDSCFSFPNAVITHALLLAFALGISVGLYETMAAASSRGRARFRLNKGYLFLPMAFLLFNVYLGYAKENFEFHSKRALEDSMSDRHLQCLTEAAAGRNRFVTLCPIGFPLDFYRAHASLGLGQLDEALAAIHRAHQLSPWNIYTDFKMGAVFGKMNRWDEAIRWYQEALRMAPEFDVARKELATAYYQKGRFKESAETLIKARFQDEENLVWLLGSAYFKLQEYEQVATTLREGLRHFPNSVQLIELLASVEYAHLKDMTNAFAHFQRLLMLTPNHPKRDEYTKVLESLAAQLQKPGEQPSRPTAVK